MAFDFKREYPALYRPGRAPMLLTVPPLRFAAVEGRGDPNLPGGDFQRAVGALYAVLYAVKMSRRGGRAMEGYFDFVVPPLEGLWRQAGGDGIDYARKADFRWTALIRQPDLVSRVDFDWAAGAAARKLGPAGPVPGLLAYDEGLCVQCMHTGPYDDEPATLARLHAFAAAQGLVPDLSGERRHHEIYLSDARRVPPERLRTVLRVPVRPG